ncbi:thiamine biosynthesis protein ApbE [Paracoccus sp. S-4012]|nr:thiamine biosynthesis protein ApbE [Paracoccus sp. S-4012]
MGRRRFLALSACALALPAQAAVPRREWRGLALGADVVLRVEGAEAGRARAFFAEAARALRSVEDRFSLYRGSDLRRLNAIGRLSRPPAEFRHLLTLARAVHDATGGAFDPTVQPLWQAVREGRAPDRALLGFAAVSVSEAEVRLPRPGMALTLNGIAQGWAADRLAAVALRHGLGEVLIDTGEIVGTGRDWDAGIAAPDGRMLRRLTLRDRALATSAPLGTRIGPEGDAPHILDPRGGAPRWSLASVSAPSAALADALSTAACVMDRRAIDRALAAFPGTRLELLAPA